MELLIASAEIVSFLFLLVILGSSFHRGNDRCCGHISFVALITTTMLGLAFDALTYILESRDTEATLLTITNVLAFSILNLCILSFSFYILSIIRKSKDISCSFVYPIVVISVVDIILIIIGSINGKFFAITDHMIQYGPWDGIGTILPVLSTLILLIVLISNVRSLGLRNTLALGSFVAFPLYAAIVVIFYPKVQLGYLASALSCSIIFTFVTREEINETQLREKILQQISSHDTLTGLMNRRGFEDALERSSEHEDVGIVFSDLNALKYTNDNFGHAAGDEYIRRFADILRHVFKDIGPICRISGDEFVILLYDITEIEFAGLKKKMNEAIRKNDRIASVGYAYGESSDALALIRLAESEMYDDKKQYYTETGLDRRRRN